MLAKIKCIGEVKSKLAYIKAVKANTHLKLKESKEFCEKTIDNPGQEFLVEITTNLFEFSKDIRDLNENILVIDTSYEREVKLVSLGLGDKESLINILSSEMASELYYKTKKNSQVDMYKIFTEYFSDFLIKLEENKLQEIFDETMKNKN